MFREPLWLALGVPVLAAAWALAAWAERRRRGVTDAMGRAATLLRSADPSPAKRPARARLRLAGLAFLLLALAGPQFGVELVETRSDARQAVIAVDCSLSMSTADVKPTRLDRAKAALSLLIDQLKGERIGVVAFAGDAQVICPLTQDADAAKELLGSIEVGAVPTPGTAIGTAIRTAAALLGRYPGGKSIVLLTDGEDHKSDPVGAAREAANMGVRVYAVGIGTPEGEPIPSANGTYHKDAKGATVVSRLDENALAQIARETGGAYYRTTPGEDEIADIARRIKETEAAKGVSGKANLWRDRYAFPAVLAFIFLLIEIILSFRPPVFSTASPKSVGVVVAVGLLVPLLSPSPSRAATAESELRAGNRLYEKKDYESALAHYAESSKRRPSDARPDFNAGDAYYRLRQAEDAAAAFESSAGKSRTPESRAAALYNLGNARYKGGDFKGAAAAYRSALALSPADAEARHNLAVAMYRQRNPPPPQKQNPKDDKKKDQPNKPEDKKDQDKPKGGGGEDGKQESRPPKTRPQDQLTREDADRVLRAVDDREKDARRKANEGKGRRVVGRPPSEEDW